jgi:hypothetical protein
MNDTETLRTINADILTAAAQRIIYLEGVSDPPMFFGLLGVGPTVVTPGSLYVHKNTAVKGLAKEGSGNTAVRRYVQVAQANNLGGKVFGVVDGDGEVLGTLATTFDPPHAGPVYTWKAYSVESFLPRTNWLAAWGGQPNWQVELQAYAPYVALNRMHVHLRSVLQTLSLAKFNNPIAGQAPLAAPAVQAALDQDKALITGYDIGVEFVKASGLYLGALASSLAEGLALLNGKWLLNHFLVQQFGNTPMHWTNQWINQATASGGLAEVRDLWERITGSAP